MSNAFIKLDIEKFYPNIDHQLLIDRIRVDVYDNRIIDFITQSIKTPTVIKSTRSDSENSCGVPQGLSISNILAAIFLSDIDKQCNELSTIKYYRYVDDILILCNESESNLIANNVIKKFKQLNLEIHPINEDLSSKSKIGSLEIDSFDYLGYSFINKKFVKDSSIEKLRASILSIFSSYKYATKRKNKDTVERQLNFLEWRLNLRITGCIFEKKRKGWLFFFSEINDKQLMYKLDCFVNKTAKRFKVKIKSKSFVKMFFQIKHNKFDSKYMPDFDNYSIEEMKHDLFFFKKDVKDLTDEEIRYEFRVRINREVKELETDVKGLDGLS